MSEGSSRAWRIARRVALVALGLYAAVVLVFALFQRKLLYHPTRFGQAEERTWASRLGATPLPSARGDTLAYVLPPLEGPPDATLIVAHGNGGAALDRDHVAVAASAGPRRFETWLVEYPGYGARQGEPDERGNVAAVVEAIDRAKPLGRPIVLYGESLGSAVVALAASERPDDVAAVVLVTPLPALAGVAAHHYPFVPTAVIVDRYEAAAALRRFPGPVAFLVAAHDEVIPAELAIAMHRDHPHPKMLVVDPSATHNSVDHRPDRPPFRAVFGFVGERLGPPGATTPR